MLPKGSMIRIKQGLGIALGIMAFGFVFNVYKIKDIVMKYPILSVGVLIASSVFLIRSGKQL